MEDKTPFLLAKSYAPAVQSRLSRFPSKDQHPIASWLIQTPVGTNYALEILNQLEDLAKKEERSASSLLFQAVSSLQTDKLQPKEIGRRLRDDLSKRVHPVSQAHRERFWEWAKRLKLPSEARLSPPQNFEGKSFTCSVDFANVAELRGRLQEILKNLEDPEWERLKEF